VISRSEPRRLLRFASVEAVRALIVSAALLGLHLALGRLHAWTFTGHLIAGLSMVAMLWGFDRLWDHSTAIFERPARILLRWGSRVPFWYIGGAVGYVVGMLVAKKAGMLAFYDIPVRALFEFGGVAGTLFQLSFVIAGRFIGFLNP
jgi:hypothetical protein